MIKKIITLFIIGRKLALSEVLSIVSKVHKIPLSIKIFFSLLGLFGKKNFNQDLDEEERLCKSLESMGVTFIKLGQFLATRPDIIGEKLSDQLQTLQDKVPAFSKDIALDEISKGVGKDNFEDFINTNQHKKNLLFLDPPYYLKKASTLYGNNGDMHETFDHDKLYKCLSKKKNWFMTYNNCDYIKNLYKDFKIIETSWSYGMNKSKKSSEIVIIG